MPKGSSGLISQNRQRRADHQSLAQLTIVHDVYGAAEALEQHSHHSVSQ